MQKGDILSVSAHLPGITAKPPDSPPEAVSAHVNTRTANHNCSTGTHRINSHNHSKSTGLQAVGLVSVRAQEHWGLPWTK